MAEDDAARWRVLAAFSFHAMCNQFMYMNFAEAFEVTESTFKVTDYAVNWFYSAAMLSACPSFILVMAFSSAYPRATSLVGVACTVVAAWLRVIAMTQRNYAIGIASSVFLGPGTAVICTGFADLPIQLFPAGWKRKVCAGIAVQSTFLGWAIGGLVASLLIKSMSSLSTIILVQAIVVSFALPIFLFANKQELAPSSGECEMLGREVVGGYGGTDAAKGGESGSEATRIESPAPNMVQSFGAMLTDWRFVMQALGCALLQGVGYALPAVQEAVFEGKGYTPLECATSGFVFIIAGVLLGLLLASPVGPAGKAPKLVLTFFWVCTLATMMLQESVSNLSNQLANMAGSHEGEHIIILFLMILGGGCSLGFLNITLPLVCADVHPVPEVYSGGLIELLAFALGAVLTQLSTDRQFLVCAGASLGAAFLMSVPILLTKKADPEQQARSSSSVSMDTVPPAGFVPGASY